VPSSDRFLFNFTDALEQQLIATFAKLSPDPLTWPNVSSLAPGRGVYRIQYPSPDIAYVGKADDLPTRLGQHLRKFEGRTGLALTDLGFTCLYVEDSLMTASPEDVLIRYYKSVGAAAWNRSGLGNNDPGKRRDRQIAAPFDTAFPIDLNFPSGIPPGTYAADEVIARFNGASGPPYILRVESNQRGDHPDALSERARTTLTLPAWTTAEDVVGALVDGLRAETTPGTPPWLGAALHGRIVVYKTTEPYPYKLRDF
jgi:hypothetical protein